MAGDESSRPELLAVCAEELAALVEHGLLDHVVRPSQDRRWDRQAEGLGGFEVDDELESCGLLDGQVGRLCALEDVLMPCRGPLVTVASNSLTLIGLP
jgi:hypothetical protein